MSSRHRSCALAELVICPNDQPTAKQTSKLARRVARELKAAGWRLERVLSDNGNESRGLPFGRSLKRLGTRHTAKKEVTRRRASITDPSGHFDVAVSLRSAGVDAAAVSVNHSDAGAPASIRTNAIGGA